MYRSRVFRNPEKVEFLRAKRRELSQKSFVFVEVLEEVDAEIINPLPSSLINTVTPSKSFYVFTSEIMNHED